MTGSLMADAITLTALQWRPGRLIDGNRYRMGEDERAPTSVDRWYSTATETITSCSATTTVSMVLSGIEDCRPDIVSFLN